MVGERAIESRISCSEGGPSLPYRHPSLSTDVLHPSTIELESCTGPVTDLLMVEIRRLLSPTRPRSYISHASSFENLGAVRDWGIHLNSLSFSMLGAFKCDAWTRSSAPYHRRVPKLQVRRFVNLGLMRRFRIEIRNPTSCNPTKTVSVTNNNDNIPVLFPPEYPSAQ